MAGSAELVDLSEWFAVDCSSVDVSLELTRANERCWVEPNTVRLGPAVSTYCVDVLVREGAGYQ